MKKRLFIATLVISALASFAANAGTWKKNNTGWWYDFGNGTYPAASWQWIDGNNDGVAECYYFNPSGYLCVNTITPDGYIVDGNGAWIENGKVKTRNIRQTTSATAPSKYISDELVYKYDYENDGRSMYYRGLDCALTSGNSSRIIDHGTFYEVTNVYLEHCDYDPDNGYYDYAGDFINCSPTYRISDYTSVYIRKNALVHFNRNSPVTAEKFYIENGKLSSKYVEGLFYSDNITFDSDGYVVDYYTYAAG